MPSSARSSSVHLRAARMSNGSTVVRVASRGRPALRTRRTRVVKRWSKSASANARFVLEVLGGSDATRPVGALEPARRAGSRPPRTGAGSCRDRRRAPKMRVAGEPHPRIGQLSTVGSGVPSAGPRWTSWRTHQKIVAAAIAARRAPAMTDREHHRTPGLVKLLCELDARLARLPTTRTPPGGRAAGLR